MERSKRSKRFLGCVLGNQRLLWVERAKRVLGDLLWILWYQRLLGTRNQRLLGSQRNVRLLGSVLGNQRLLGNQRGNRIQRPQRV